MKTIVTVCARGGSKGVKGKNVRPLLGIPMIVHTLRQSKAAGVFDFFAVSSDSDQILAYAEEEGFYPFRRPDEMASDTAAKIPVIRHCVEMAEKKLGITFDYCIDLDCTSPLRNIDDIKAVLELVKKTGVPNAITAMPSRKSPYFNMVEVNKEGEVRLVKEMGPGIFRRQDVPPCYDMNASIYGWKRHVLMTEDKLFLKGTALHVMPEDRSIDIDSELDFNIVELIMNKRGNYENP